MHPARTLVRLDRLFRAIIIMLTPRPATPVEQLRAEAGRLWLCRSNGQTHLQQHCFQARGRGPAVVGQ